MKKETMEKEGNPTVPEAAVVRGMIFLFLTLPLVWLSSMIKKHYTHTHTHTGIRTSDLFSPNEPGC